MVKIEPDGRPITKDIKQFIKQTIEEILDECIGEEMKNKPTKIIKYSDNSIGNITIDFYRCDGYNKKRQELIDIKNKLIK